MAVSSPQIQQLAKLISDISNGDMKDIAKECAELSLEGEENDELSELRKEVLKLAQKQMEASEFINNLAKGNLSIDAPKKNRLVDPYKELQANLRHLVWQTQEIARGDYSQRVDFLGDFSKSFNALVEALQEKNRLEEALKSSEEKYRDIFENSIEGIFQSTLDGKLLDVNPAYAYIFGYDSPQEMIGQIRSVETELYFRPEDRQLLMERLYKDGFARNMELRFKKRDGSLFWVLSNSRMVLNANGEPVYMEGTMVDITSRKQAEEVVNLSEARLKRAELASLAGNWELHLDSNIIIASDGARAIYELDKNIVDYPLIKTLPLNEYRQKLNNAMRQLIEEGIPYDIEFKIKSPLSGAIKDIYSQAIYDKNKKIVFGIIQDITERKRNEKALKESENKFRSLFSEMSEGFALHELIYDADKKAIDYRILEINPAFETQVGILAEKANGAVASELYGVSPAPYLDIYARVAETGEHQIFQTYFPPFDRHFEISVFSPNPGYFATVFTDITERKKAEEENERTQKLLEDSQRIGKIGGWEMNLDTMELNWTKEMYNIHEVDLSFRPKVDLRASFYTPESVPLIDKAVSEAIEQGGSYDIDVEIITAKGNRRSIRTIGKADLKSRRMIGFFQDITERKVAENELKASEAQLRELNATKDKFFSIIAHDLKSPFNSILGLSSILEERVSEKNYEDIGEFATLIRNSSELAYDLLKNLLEWSRSQTGKMEFSPEYLDLVTLINEAFQLLKNSAHQKSIVVTMSLPKNVLAFADRVMVGTILRNLISNAIKFTKPGGEITISAEGRKEEVIISVKDNGVGIRKEDIGKIFRIDENFSTTGTLNEKGTGLGLILCKEFIEKHGGHIWIESEIGKGSQFCFSIPKI